MPNDLIVILRELRGPLDDGRDERRQIHDSSFKCQAPRLDARCIEQVTDHSTE